jgi:hypothetical protein
MRPLERFLMSRVREDHGANAKASAIGAMLLQ